MLVTNFRFFLCLVFFLAFAGQAVRNTVDWVGYGIIVLVTVAGFVWFLLKRRKPVTVVRVSVVVGYLMFTLILSTIFSSYRLWSLLGVGLTFLTGILAWLVSRFYRWSEVKVNLWVSLTMILVLSFILEIIVAFMGVPLLPIPLQNVNNPPGLFYWVQGAIFEGGPIQGIVGNRNLLGFIALLVLLLSVFDNELSVKWRIIGAGLAFSTILLTRSATITVALVGCFVIAGGALVMRWWRTKYERTKYVVLTFVTGALLTGGILLYQPIIGLLNREPDMTDRFDIWGKVWGLFLEQPVTGWGWLGHWVPFVEPFAGLVVKDGVTHLHAHNAYLDVLFQAGVLGFIGFVVLIVIVGVRSWKLSVDGRTMKSLIPLVLLIALLIQGVTESRLLLEGNLLLFMLIVFHVQTKTPGFTVIVDDLRSTFTGSVRTVT